MKATYTAIAALAAAFTITSCCQKAADDNKFVVGFDADFPPYGYQENGEFKGFDLDLAREVCARRGWTFVANPINWDAKDMELDSGAIDCIWNGFTINGREDKYTWTEAYVDNSQVVLVKEGSAIQTLADLTGKVVAVQTDTPVQAALAADGDKADLGKTFAKTIVSATYNQAVMELEMGSVDAVAMDVGVAEKKMSDKPGVFRMLDEQVMSEQYGIGFKLGNTELRDQVQATLKEMVADGTAAKISAKYFNGEDHVILKP